MESGSGRHSRESENPALTIPLSYTGTPEELDAELGRELAGYVACHQALGSTPAAAKAESDSAAKTAQKEASKKAEERKEKSEKPADKPADPAPLRFRHTPHHWRQGVWSEIHNPRRVRPTRQDVGCQGK